MATGLAGVSVWAFRLAANRIRAQAARAGLDIRIFVLWAYLKEHGWALPKKFVGESTRTYDRVDDK
jgi:hypothetical protein